MYLYNGKNWCYLFNPGLKLGITRRKTKMFMGLLAQHNVKYMALPGRILAKMCHLNLTKDLK